jgi:hypothetical protein
MSVLHPTELTILLRHCRERDEVGPGVAYSGYDVFWPDGQPAGVGLRRFCRHGTRLLLGRHPAGAAALVRMALYPVASRESALTRPGPGVRCRRLYALREPDHVRLYFVTGHPTEVLFDPAADEPRVLRWLQVEWMRPGVPFWFDLACETLPAVPEAAGVSGEWRPGPGVATPGLPSASARAGVTLEAGVTARSADA